MYLWDNKDDIIIIIIIILHHVKFQVIGKKFKNSLMPNVKFSFVQLFIPIFYSRDCWSEEAERLPHGLDTTLSDWSQLSTEIDADLQVGNQLTHISELYDLITRAINYS